MAALADATHYWKASDYSGSGTTWPDGIGTLDATLVGSPTWDGEKFTFTKTQHATIPDHADFDVGAAEAFSIVVVHAPVDLTDSIQSIFDIGLALSSVSPGFWLALISDGRHQIGIEDDTATSTNRTNDLGSSDGEQIIVGGGMDRTNGHVWNYSPTSGTRNTTSVVPGTITPTQNNGIAANNSGGAQYAGDIWGVAYFHGVELTNAEVESIGAELALSPGPTFPDAPTNLAATAVSATQVDLSWDAVSGASGYDIRRGGVVIATDQAGTTYSDTSSDGSTLYEVRAVG
jgi:hypothetical protein